MENDKIPANKVKTRGKDLWPFNEQSHKNFYIWFFLRQTSPRSPCFTSKSEFENNCEFVEIFEFEIYSAASLTPLSLLSGIPNLLTYGDNHTAQPRLGNVSSAIWSGEYLG
jgi:hypothetical protein